MDPSRPVSKMAAGLDRSHTQAAEDARDFAAEISTLGDFFNVTEEFNVEYHFPQGNHHFVPRGLTEKLSEKCIIRKFITSEDLVDKIFGEARTLFVISASGFWDPVELQSFLDKAIKGNITDKVLPINTHDSDRKYRCAFGDDKKLLQFAKKSFDKDQQHFCLPTFENTWHGYFTEKWGMPVDVQRHIGKGAIAQVYEAKIHPDHDRIGKAGSYALKSYELTDETTLTDQDIQAFQDGYKTIDHEHIVNLLTSWRHIHTWYMVFPLAKSNLAAYMESHYNCKGEDVRNLLKQLYGLSAAMAAFHAANPDSNFLSTPGDKPTRSGYIRPENILVFKGLKDQGDIFKWSDFGSAQFENWGLRTNMLEIFRGVAKMGKLTYQAPEACMRGECGSKSDVWAMGVVFLEVIVWLLLGPKGLPRLALDGDGREVGAEPGTLRFFNVTKKRIVPWPAVTSMLREIEKHPKCRGQLKVLRGAIAKMLTIDSERRPSSQDVKNMLSALDDVGGHDFDDGYPWAPKEIALEPERDVSGISIVVTSSDP